jgi:hypothetical protein
MPKSTTSTDCVSDALAAITRAADALFKHTNKAVSIQKSTTRTTTALESDWGLIYLTNDNQSSGHTEGIDYAKLFVAAVWPWKVKLAPFMHKIHELVSLLARAVVGWETYTQPPSELATTSGNGINRLRVLGITLSKIHYTQTNCIIASDTYIYWPPLRIQ